MKDINYPSSKVVIRPSNREEVELFPICQFDYISPMTDQEIQNLINNRSKLELEFGIRHLHKINDYHFVVYVEEKYLKSKRVQKILDDNPKFKL